ncbi:MAG: hypothetical protein RLZZ273_286 [Bacteroidota bacterium]
MYTRMHILCCLLFGGVSASAGVWPAGGTLNEPMKAGVSVCIRWDATLMADHVDVELWDGERRLSTPIAKSVAAYQGHILWDIPHSATPGRLYRFVVRDADNPIRAEYSSGFHRIYGVSEFATTVEEGIGAADSLIVTPFPAGDRARVAWTTHDATTVEVFDMQGVAVLTVSPPSQTRACAINTSTLLSGQYTVVLKLTNGVVRRRPLMVSH